MWAKIIATALTGALLGAIQAAALHSRPKVQGAAEIYATSPAIKVLLHACPVLFGAWAAWSFFEPPRWDALIPLAFAVMALFGQPNDIVLNDVGITSTAWLRQATYIKWSDITEIVYRKGSGATYIYGKGGTKIVHSYLHADSARFRQNIENRACIPVSVKRGY